MMDSTSLAMDVPTLSEMLITEMVQALSLPPGDKVRSMVRMIFGKGARRVAELGVALDQQVGEHGVAAGARWLLPNFTAGFEANGQDLIPPDGPLVIAANHPAAVDSIAVSAYMTRPDYKIIIGEIPFFRNLPHVRANSIFAPAPKDAFGRMQTVRDILRHLKEGGAILIFPRGNIEPDPDFMAEPGSGFHSWSRSLEIFLEHVPQTRVLVTMVSGVISQAAMRHPLTWLRRRRPDRQRLAFMYQFLRQVLTRKETFGLVPRITFGEVLSSLNPSLILSEVEGAAQRTLDRHLEWIHR